VLRIGTRRWWLCAGLGAGALLALLLPSKGTAAVGGTQILELTLTSSPNPSTQGESVQLTAAYQEGILGGTITFSDNGQVLGTASISVTGLTTLQVTPPFVGSQTITASFSGNSTFAASSVSHTQVVQASSTSTAAACASQVGDTCTVSGQLNATYTKTGSMQAMHTVPVPAGALVGSVPLVLVPTTRGSESVSCTPVSPVLTTTCVGRLMGDALEGGTVTARLALTNGQTLTLTGVIRGRRGQGLPILLPPLLPPLLPIVLPPLPAPVLLPVIVPGSPPGGMPSEGSLDNAPAPASTSESASSGPDGP
jgi:hypothetical protein